MSPLLITTAIQPPPDVYVLKMTLAEKRLALAKAAAFFWAGFGVRRIVVADATGRMVLSAEDIRILAAMGVEVEQISYRQDDRAVIEKGKGYGEGELIQFSLRNSVILGSATHFYKCTSRLFCRNFNAIDKALQQNRIQNMFWQEPLATRIDTRFFHASKSFCEQFLLPAYQQIDDRRGMTSEVVMYELARSRLTYGRSLRPLLSGFSGSLDRPHFDQSLGFLDSSVPCWLSR